MCSVLLFVCNCVLYCCLCVNVYSTWSINKIMCLNQDNSVFNFKLQINFVPLTIVHFRSTHLWRRFSNSSLYRRKSPNGIAFSWSVTAVSMFFTVPKWRYLKQNFSFWNKQSFTDKDRGVWGLLNHRNEHFNIRLDPRPRM
jgi:uncharacterized membrane protein